MNKGEGKVVVVTGAAAGIARATVAFFTETVCRTRRSNCPPGTSQFRLEETQQEVERLGGRTIAIPTDVADFEQVETAAERERGSIDVWENNAMLTIFAPLQDVSAQEIRQLPM